MRQSKLTKFDEVTANDIPENAQRYGVSFHPHHIPGRFFSVLFRTR